MLLPPDVLHSCWFVWSAITLAISGCAGTTAQSTLSTGEKPEPGLEQLISLPIQQGRTGFDQVANFLHHQYAAHFKNGRISSLDTGGKLILADGYILLDASTRIPQRISGGPEVGTEVTSISLAISETPCFTLEQFIQISGAHGEPPGAYSTSDYKIYNYRGAEIDTSAHVKYPDFECIYFINLNVIN
ncbi:MAG: hypothetical protein LBL59_09645 [Xanthomonadaceae bacterium]|jgi:hypothetical protein|nr:hypothetical protein [Xanthomonadaceae bacterium]